jgi:hypothetical protein
LRMLASSITSPRPILIKIGFCNDGRICFMKNYKCNNGKQGLTRDCNHGKQGLTRDCNMVNKG